MLLRAFSKREKVLMSVLAAVLLLAFYLLTVHYPVQENLARLEQERADLELDAQIAQIQYDKYQAMREELDALLSQSADRVTVMPDYDNLQPLMNRLNQIFTLAASYDMSFSPVELDGATARRTIQASFTCAAYEDARSIVEQLCHTGWRCLVSDLTLGTPQNTGDLAAGAVTASVTITFFEYDGQGA